MTEKQMKSNLRRSHRWVGALAAIFILLAAGSGFLLQHPTWLGPAANPVFAVAADPVVSGRLLRGTHWGVEKSTDDGLTWREVNMLAAPLRTIPSYNCLSSASPPETSTLPGASSMLSFFTTQSSTSMA